MTKRSWTVLRKHPCIILISLLWLVNICSAFPFYQLKYFNQLAVLVSNNVFKPPYLGKRSFAKLLFRLHFSKQLSLIKRDCQDVDNGRINILWHFRYCFPLDVLAQFQRCLSGSWLRCTTPLRHQHVLLIGCCLCDHIRAVATFPERRNQMEIEHGKR